MATTPRLTIGTANYDDAEGVWFTFQSIRQQLRKSGLLEQIEFVVVDNAPDSPGSNELRKKVKHQLNRHTAGTRYVDYTDAIGTCPPREKIFRVARGEAVLVLDSHVLIEPGAIERLIAWYDAHPNSFDIMTGPMWSDDLERWSTHFNDEWRGQMWGTWGTAWLAPDGAHVVPIRRAGNAYLASLEMSPREVGEWDGQESSLLDRGYRRLGEDDDEFEIPGMGLGLFSCRREAWPGFNKHFRGFGGGELYIHEKFRRNGGRALSLGFLKWLHRFMRPRGVQYPLVREAKVRNYVIGHQELGRSLDPMRQHFVDGKLIGLSTWEKIIADPIKYSPPKPKQARPNKPVAIVGLRENAEPLRSLAGRVEHATEFSSTKESLLQFAHAQVKRVVSYNAEANDPHVRQVCSLVPSLDVRPIKSEAVEIEDTDLLFLDTARTKSQLLADLVRYAPRVKRYIVLHGTVPNGQEWADGRPGMFAAIRSFFEETEQGREWFTMSHSHKGNGLTALGRLPEDRPEEIVPLWVPEHGPGTELIDLLKLLGIVMPPDCDCKHKAMQMNIWGVYGCRKHRDTIIGWIREGKERWGWGEALAPLPEGATLWERARHKAKEVKLTAKAARAAIPSGLAFAVNPLDPIPGLVEEAIRRAEVKEAQRTGHQAASGHYRDYDYSQCNCSPPGHQDGCTNPAYRSPSL